jgi:hypothetical protein
MDDDTQITTGGEKQPEEERQNRRQFFNGLGKWSLAIIAAVTALRDGLNDGQDDIGARFGAPSIGAGEPLQQVARHGNSPHQNDHLNVHTDYTRTCVPGTQDCVGAARRGVKTPSGPTAPKGRTQ